MNIKDFKVGQTVYVELTGNASGGKTPEQCIEEWEITSVGRKYIKACKKAEYFDLKPRLNIMIAMEDLKRKQIIA